MRTSKLSFLFTSVFALTLGACGGDDGGGDDGNDTGDTDPTATMTDPTATMTDPTATMTDPTATMTDPTATMTDPTETVTDTDPTDTDTDATATDPSTGPDPDSGTDTGPGTDTGTGGGEVCAPEGDDDECQACTKEMCCDQLETCAGDADCACVLECLSMVENPGIPEAMECANTCEADFLMVAGPLTAIDMCRMSNCGEACGPA
jgi:hypothetical protein